LREIRAAKELDWLYWVKVELVLEEGREELCRRLEELFQAN